MVMGEGGGQSPGCYIHGCSGMITERRGSCVITKGKWVIKKVEVITRGVILAGGSWVMRGVWDDQERGVTTMALV
jgi:hypothetical protein